MQITINNNLLQNADQNQEKQLIEERIIAEPAIKKEPQKNPFYFTIFQNQDFFDQQDQFFKQQLENHTLPYFQTDMLKQQQIELQQKPYFQTGDHTEELTDVEIAIQN